MAKFTKKRVAIRKSGNNNAEGVIGLITVFEAILTGKAKRSEITVFVYMGI